MQADEKYHPLRCQCGQVSGTVALAGGMPRNRIVCFCRDCQAFARWTGESAHTLDAQGGTDVVQVAADQVSIHSGADLLACVKLRPKGLLRWYTRCCHTPLGNTMDKASLSFVGLIHTALDSRRLQQDFGPVLAVANSGSALGSGAPKDHGLPRVVFNVMRMIVGGWVRGAARRNPFFKTDGQPVVEPHVLSVDELTRCQASGEALP